MVHSSGVEQEKVVLFLPEREREIDNWRKEEKKKRMKEKRKKESMKTVARNYKEAIN